MTVVALIAAILLIGAAVLTSYRILAGPGTLDRVVGVDSLVAIAASGLAVWAAYSDDTSVLPGIVALALVGFLGSAAVTRFRVRDDR
ncbi:monovalent cation/H+ antiporter complex subunit F [Nocardia terpenica]|uniref:Cation:proton antiporter n=1 Tax=Nocardia terpenica TaxID=455432 RepID=A0A164K4I2_9NOCA|nr:monovalent cation/H+ antiporter complex subunit F [Nocardia terpenica]KZM71020.1 cation:proton antiporter [Nocardia terpenica]MBF6062650.1 cation:proton antiporter [Nocardia terpenica]MBF6105215.1 cation:proton antiporter [Nocardia terpenica]MBF6112348.1 cation:proton antiporter [Nocardia terpenica]MBF6118943.1 cation:proton antiporter [Nocardia terpenica]